MQVNELALKIMDAQRDVGYAVRTVWTNYRDKYLPVIMFHEISGSREWNPDIAEKYREDVRRRADINKIGDAWYRRLMSGVDEMEYFYDTGKLRWPFFRTREDFQLKPYYREVKDAFLSSEPIHPNTQGDIRWVCDKYFFWLQNEGIESLRDADAKVIQEFIRFCSVSMKASSLYNVRIYLKKLYRFLFENGYTDSSHEVLFYFRVSRDRPQQPAADPEEVAATLEAIDRTPPQGKRDYAMILLGAVLGMRAGDIIRLKLRDIDWANGEIHICQSKTGKPLALPLTQEVGEALKDYILNGRPDCDYEEVFIRMKAPRQPYTDATGIQYLYSEYRRKAGLTRSAFDGKGFHSLRRAVGKNMVTSGVPVTTVAQILGQTNVNSTQKYLALDSHHLKECALDFSGIEVMRS